MGFDKSTKTLDMVNTPFSLIYQIKTTSAIHVAGGHGFFVLGVCGSMWVGDCTSTCCSVA